MYKIILIILLPILLWGQNYLWPTNASNYMSSSFCEYRPGHFHAAIDIKTWNTEGYPCYAVDDGQIIKIRVSPFGYGKAIYLKLKDGRMAVYGHLQRFNKSLEKKVRAEQIKNRRYSLSFNPGNVKVKKGETIAFSGQTGIGVPHLHFEIRDSEGRPLNPLKFYKTKIKDKIAPKLLELLIIPRDEHSSVNGSFLPKAVPLKLMDNNIYIIKEPLFIKGRVGLALRGYDRADGVYNKFSCYRQALTVNDKKIFQSKYDKIDFRTTGQIDIAIYYPAKVKTGKVFNKLFIEPYNSLPFYKRSLGSGIIETGDKPLRFLIETQDFFGNSSKVTGMLQPDLSAPAQMQIIRQMNDLVFLKLKLPRQLDQLQFSSQAADGSNRTIAYYEILKSTFAQGMQTLLVKLKLKQTNIKALTCRFHTRKGKAVQCLTLIPEEAGVRPDIKIINSGKSVTFVATRLPQSARGEILCGGRKLTLTKKNQKIQRTLPAREVTCDSLHFRIYKVDSLLADSALFFHTLYPGEGRYFSFYGKSCIIQSSPKTVYDTLLFTLDRKSAEEIYLPQASALKAAAFIQNAVYRLKTAPRALRKSLQISLKYDSLSSGAPRLGIYKINKKGKIRFAGNHRDSLHFYISAQIRSGGDYFLLADTLSPHVKILYPRQGAVLKSLNKIAFSAEDSLSGIGDERNLAIAVDGRFVIPEWDPERRQISGRPHWKLSPGEHSIRISVSDRAGNKTQKNLDITIKEQ